MHYVIFVTPDTLLAARTWAAVDEIKALSKSTRDSWHSKTLTDTIAILLKDFWNNQHDRWSAFLDKNTQKAAISHLVRTQQMDPPQAERIITNWKSSRRYLRPDDWNFEPFNTSKTTHAIHKSNGYDIDKVEQEHRQKCENTESINNLVKLLIENFQKMCSNDPLLAHNCRILFVTLVCTRCLGLRPQQTCAPREIPEKKKHLKPTEYREFHEWNNGKIKGSVRRSYVSIWNCKETEYANFRTGPNRRVRFCKYWRKRCKRRVTDIFKSHIWVIRDLFEHEIGRPFHKGIFAYMEEARDSMRSWAAGYPKMQEFIKEKTWAIFVKKKGGARSNSYRVRRYQQGDPAKLLQNAQEWLAKYAGWKPIAKLKLYNLRHKQAVQSFCDTNQYVRNQARELGHKSNSAIYNYLSAATNRQLLGVHRQFANTIHINSSLSRQTVSPSPTLF